MKAINPVELPDGSKRKNYINLEMSNFNITDKGDLQDMVDYQNFNDVDALEDGLLDLDVPEL